MGWSDTLRALLRRSAHTPTSGALLSLDSPAVVSVRKAMGGQLQPIAVSQVRWYQEDLEAAEHAADRGDLALAARLMRAARRDGVIAGVLSTCTGGLVRMPKRFRGKPEVVAALEAGHDSIASVFDEMFPASELALLAADGRLLGVAVGELVPVEGRDYPVLVRLDPEFLIYRWDENRWYYRTIAGLVAITPGDGKWILHLPGGRSSPWQNGTWKAIGRAFIRKEHANLAKDNWESKLANPARVATSPAGATEEHRSAHQANVEGWGYNTTFALPAGYGIELLESNGNGAESFRDTIREQNQEIIITLAGQTVTTDGGSGFSNSDVHRSIRGDILAEVADTLAYTINTQGLPPFIVERFGDEALDDGGFVSWDVSPPKDRGQEANALVTTANALKSLTEALSVAGSTDRLDVGALCARFGVPLVQTAENLSAGRPSLRLVAGGVA